MPANSKSSKPPKPSKTRPAIPVPPVESVPEDDSGTPVSGNVAIRLSRSGRRMLRHAKCSEKRPELLAMFDFKPLYNSGGSSTLAGEMFKARVTARSQQLESIKDLIKDLENELPDEFMAATNQYVSTLASVEADISLLKLLILLRLYATHTARFLEFKNEYKIPESTDLSFLPGDAVAGKIQGILKVGGMTEAIWSTAMVPLIQILVDLPLCSYALMPRSLIGGGGMISRKSNKTDGIAASFPMKAREAMPVFCLGWVTKDILASYEFVKLKVGDEIDETFEELVAEFLDSNFLTSNNNVRFRAFANMIGTDIWGYARSNTDMQSRFNTFTQKAISMMISGNKGILGKAAVQVEGVGKVMIPETASQIYNFTEYGNIDGMVDKAFSGNPPLDFTEFDEVIGDFTTSLRKLQTFGNTMFRMGDKAKDFAPGPRGFPLVADEMPFTLGSSAMSALDLWNRRFLTPFKAAVYNPATELLGDQHIMFVRMMAWIMIRDDYEQAYKYVSAVITDYEKGFLTAAGIPEETVIDEETGETEIAATSFVLPGTSTPANLGSVGTHLGSRISSTEEWFLETYRSYSPVCIADTEFMIYAAGHSFEGTDGEDYSIQGTKHAWTCGDLQVGDFRLVNPMFRYYEAEGNYGKNWLGTKILACEVVDAVFELLRSIMSPIGEPDPIEDGDPVFPSLQFSKTPYDASSLWSYCDPAYEGFATEMWVPTIEFWLENFARPTSKTTYFRSTTLRSHCKNLLRMLSKLMNNAGPDISLCVYSEPERQWTTNAMMTKRYGFMTVTFKCPTDSEFHWARFEDYWSQTGKSINAILDCTSWDDLDDLNVPVSNGSSNSPNWVNERLQRLHNACINFAKTAHNNDVVLEFMYEFLGSYADRVDAYNAAVQGLVEGENSALGTFSQQLLDAGDAGTDVLQNITPNQLALKQIALDEERGDENNGYVPTLSVLTNSEVRAVKIMAREPNATSPEGDNAKIIFVGLPAGLFDSLEIEEDFGIRVSYVDIEYPQIVFKPKVYPFKKDIYLMPDDLERSMSSYDSIEDIMRNVQFTKLAVEVIESGDTAASIQIKDRENRARAGSSATYPTYTNHLVSELLKMYVRIMLGFNFNESAFLGNPEGLQTPINDYAQDLAGAMAAGIDAITATNSSVGRKANSLVRNLESIEADVFVSGELEPVDEALLTNLRDAFQTRLFSAEIMKTRVMSAKFFDRIFGLIVDPDEFYILAPGDIDACGVTTSQKILDFYLQKGIIEWVGNERTGGYKLVPRTTAEGRMAFGKFHVSVTSFPANPDTAWEK